MLKRIAEILSATVDDLLATDAADIPDPSVPDADETNSPDGHDADNGRCVIHTPKDCAVSAPLPHGLGGLLD